MKLTQISSVSKSVEQANNRPFNRGWLFNAGFLETEQEGDYWITHDVDMIPVSADYSYPQQPTHLATRCSQFNYAMPYPEYFGGVVLYTAQQFRSVNGFVNSLRGWGAEDDILYRSFIARGITPERRDCTFECLPHERKINNADYQFNIALWRRPRNFNDGLNTCRYSVLLKEEREQYTHLKVTNPGAR